MGVWFPPRSKSQEQASGARREGASLAQSHKPTGGGKRRWTDFLRQDPGPMSERFGQEKMTCGSVHLALAEIASVLSPVGHVGKIPSKGDHLSFLGPAAQAPLHVPV